MQKAIRFILYHATGRNVLLSGVAFLLMATVIMPEALRDFLSVSNGLLPLDLLPWHSPQTTYEYLHAYGQEGRNLYRFILLAADMVFPMVYLTFFSLALGWMVKKQAARHKLFVLLPLFVCLLDFLENACLLGMLRAWPEQLFWLAAVGSVFTGLRWLALLLVAGVAVGLAWKTNKNKRSKIIY